ncbi:MAG TPA: AMP-binding protein [bacterium]|nr:AMP-binding protein [bacterium]
MTRTDSLYDPVEALGPEARTRRQSDRLRAAVAAAFDHAPATRARLHGCGLRPEQVRDLRDLASLPVLRKDTLPQAQAASPPFAGLLGAPLASLRRIYVSPGPIYDPEPRRPDYWGLAPALHAAGFRGGDVVLVTFAFHLTPAGHMMDGALDRLGCVVVPGGVGNTEVQARALVDLGVTGLIGTPSFVAALLERSATLGLRHRVEIAFVSGEVLPVSLRQRIQEGFGVRIAQGYATADVGVIAYECPLAQGLHLSDRVAVELLDPETEWPVPPGSAGEVVVSLLEPPYALLRFGTGDLSAEVSGPCPCGRTAPRLAGIAGRVGEAVKIRGLFVHPAEVDRVLLGVAGVARYQVVVTRPDHHDEATLRVEVRPGADAAAVVPRAGAAVHDGLRLRLEVEVVPPGTIADGAPRILDLRRWR